MVEKNPLDQEAVYLMMAVGMKVVEKVINSMVMERTISMMAVCMKVVERWATAWPGNLL